MNIIKDPGKMRIRKPDKKKPAYLKVTDSIKKFTLSLKDHVQLFWMKHNNKIGSLIQWGGNLAPGFWSVVVKGLGKIVASAKDTPEAEKGVDLALSIISKGDNTMSEKKLTGAEMLGVGSIMLKKMQEYLEDPNTPNEITMQEWLSIAQTTGAEAWKEYND